MGKLNKNQLADHELRKAIADFLTIYISSCRKTETNENYYELIVKKDDIQNILNP